MADWSDGYVSDIGYTYGYYGELNPNSVTIPFLKAGLAVPKFVNACELGFGQGMSINAHACASDINWFGTDFNPAHASFAQGLENIAGSGAHLVDEAFSEFCRRDDLPDFDFIGLHGIWSWVSHENRRIIAEFIRKKLKVGGVLYVSYNILPGWSAAAPIRHMLAEHAHVMGARGEGSVQRVQNSVSFTQELLSLCQAYQNQVPSVANRIKTIGEQDPHYLAHEYFNRDWHPMYFADMCQWLAEAKVSYACSANYLDDFPFSNFTEEQRAFLEKIVDPMFLQSVKDFLLNKQFRKDYWVKGPRTLSEVELEQAWQELRFLLMSPKDEIKLKISGAVGELDLIEKIYNPVINVLADYQVHTVADIMHALKGEDISQQLLFEVLAILHAKNDIALVQDDEKIKTAKPRCKKLNSHLLKQSLVSNDVRHLVSPLVGGAIDFSRIGQLFLYAYSQGLHRPEEWVQQAWQALERQGHRVIKDGKTLEGREENIAELNRLAEIFAKETLPIAKNLQIIEGTSVNGLENADSDKGHKPNENILASHNEHEFEYTP